MAYPDLEFTNFPEDIDSFENVVDVTQDLLSAANAFRAAMLAGEYATAQSILAQNPNLKNTMIDAVKFNQLMHAVMAVERYFKGEVYDDVKGYRDEAVRSGEAAVASAAQAKTSAENAERAESEASQSAEKAETSRLAAQNAKINAETYASRASSSAGAAATSATQARTSENKADEYAREADDYRAEAATAARTAAQDAVAAVQNLMMPVGYIYQWSPVSGGPDLSTPAKLAAYLGFGTWQAVAEGRVLMGADADHAAGTTAEAGLPDIVGAVRVRPWTPTSGSASSLIRTASGAFSTEAGTDWNAETAGANATKKGADWLRFRASSSNAIYGGAETVQPPALRVYFYQRVA